MLLVVVALLAATIASGAWCAAEILPGQARKWWLAGASIRPSAVLLVAVLGLAAWLRFVLVPAHHAMYLDEPWYAEAACNLARLGRPVVCQQTWNGASCIPFEKAWGWPVVMSPWIMLVGCDSAAGIALNRGIGTATVLLAALVARCAGARWWQCVVVAALLAIHPVHVAWSATGETNVSAAATLLVGLCGALVYVRWGRLCAAALAISALALATAIRPESFVPAAVCAAVVALVAPTSPMQRRWVAVGICIAGAAAAASGLQLWTMNESISGGAFLSLGGIVRSAQLLTGAGSLSIHGLVLVSGLAGFLLMARSHQRGAAWLLLCSSLAAALVALAYERFHERMLLAATVGLLPLSGFLFDWSSPTTTATRGRLRGVLGPLVGTAFVCVLGLLWRDALLAAAAPPETQLLETRIASRIGRLPLEPDALIVTAQPPIAAAAGLAHVMATGRALDDLERLRAEINAGRPVYFLCDMYCEVDLQGTATPPLCSQILERFALSPVAEETLNDRTYILYRLAAAAGGGTAPLRCPRSRGPAPGP